MRFILPLLALASCAANQSTTDGAAAANANTPAVAAADRGALKSPGYVEGTSSIPFQKYVLDNGLELVIHEDHSAPVAAVYVYYHVGSAREVPGRSGFAHLFEHMLFQGSEHVGDDQHFHLVQEAGGTLNGSTTTDRTNYFEVLPANQVELALWLESDRMGFLLPAMTQAKLDNQRDVVKNERRQNYENRPYGQAEGVIEAALYPADHPYSWLTIGSQEDLTAARLDDVKAFFQRWYGPNNATLAVGGDVDPAKVVAMVRKYFGSLPRGPAVATPTPRPTKLTASKRLIMQDKVKLPELTITWPTVAAHETDEPALDFLGNILAANNSAILDKALMIDEQLASQVSANNQSREIAGEFSVTVRPHPRVTLDTLEQKTMALIEKLAKDGVDPKQLERVKSRYEANMIRRQETVGQRTATLADYNTFTKNPGYLDIEIARHLAVTPADIQRVLATYVVGKPAIVLSVVPDGKPELAASGSTSDAKSLASAIEASAPKDDQRAKTPTPTAKLVSGADAAFDRTQKPGPGAASKFHSPAVWHTKLSDGIPVVGTHYSAIPMTSLSLSVPAGRLYETMGTLGLSSMTAEMLQQGTTSLSATEFTEELDRLGASLRASADDTEITLSLSCLDKHLDEAMKLLGDVVLHPRFAEDDFKRIQKARLVALETRSDQIRAIAGDAYRRLLWGDTVAGMPTEGTHATIEKLSLDDLKTFWREHVVPSGARLTWVGRADANEVSKLFATITGEWTSSGAPPKLEAPKANAIAGTKLYLVDKPGAAQSELRLGHLSLASTDPDFYPLNVLNQPLGGAFTSRVNLNLREDKGYTYGARTGVDGGVFPGAFTASAAVKTDVTKESVFEFMKELKSIEGGITDKELAFTKDSLAQSMLRQFEATRDLSAMVENISKYGWPDDYADQRLKQLMSFTLDDMKRQATTNIHPDAMVLLVVGDKQKIAKGLGELGYGDPIELDVDGVPIAAGATDAK